MYIYTYTLNTKQQSCKINEYIPQTWRRQTEEKQTFCGQTLQVSLANDISFKSVSSSIAGGFSGASEVTTAYINSIIIIIFCQ